MKNNQPTWARIIAAILLATFPFQTAGANGEILGRVGASFKNWVDPLAYAAEETSSVVVSSPKYSDFVWTARQSSLSTASVSTTTTLAAPACHNLNGENHPGVQRWEQATPGGVNLSSGNFALSHQDLIIPGRGLSLEITRTYNSQPAFELPGWSHETNRGGSSWFVDQNSLRGEGDRILTERVFQNPVTLSVRMKTLQAQPGEADVPDLADPNKPTTPSSWYTAWVNFAYQDYRNFYYFLIHRNGTLELSKLSGGALVTLKTTTSTLSPFDWHTVRVEVNGNSIQCTVDGTLRLQHTEAAAIPSGKVGLNAYWSHALFDDLSVTDSAGIMSDDFNRKNRQEDALFGWGWTWNYGLAIEGTQVVTKPWSVKRADGGQYSFTPPSDGQSATPPPGCYGQLYKFPDGTARYREKDGLLHEFDSQGRHTRMVDRNGNSITLNYDSQGRPATVTGPTGLALTLSYGANGKVSTLTDPEGRVIRYEYDAAGHLTAVADPLGNVVRYAYHSSHSMKSWSTKSGAATTNAYWYNNRVGSQTDPLGKATRFQYWWDNTIVQNARGESWTYAWKEGQWDKPVWIQDPQGRREGYAWDAQGNRIGVTNRNGHLTAFMYDTKGNVIRVVKYKLEDPSQILSDTRFSYDSTFNQVTRTVDAKGNVTTFDYDPNGNLIKTTKSLGTTSLVTEMTYDPSGLLLSVKDPLGNITRYEYNSHGRKTAVIDPLGNRAGFTYDLIGRLLTTTDPLGRIITNTYDTNGNLLTVTNTLGHKITTAYDADGRLLTVTDPNGQVTQNEYDGIGNLMKVTAPLGAVTTTTFDSTNLLHLGSIPKTSETDPLGNTTRITYDAYDRPLAVTDPLGNTATTTYDPFGNVTAQTDPEGRTSTFTYDPLSRKLTATDPLGSTTRFSYDSVGNILTATDPNGNITRYEYDALGRRIAVVEATGSRTTYAYDVLDRLLTVTDAKGNVTRMTYDALGRKISMDDPDMGHWEYAYNALGNLIRQTDAKGQILEFTYDTLSRVTLKKGLPPQGTVPVILATYLYDDSSKPNGVGRLSKLTDPSGSTEFFYDALGREVKTLKTIGAQAFTVQKAYDLNGRLTQLTYPEGEVVQYTYDAAGRPTRVEGAEVYMEAAAYNKASQLTRLTYGNQVATDYTYDAAGQIRQILTAQGRLQDLSYTFDASGNILSITDRVGTATQSFTYDSLHRLTQAAGASYGTRAYRYDALGNLLEKDGVAYTYGQNGTKPHAVTAGSDGFAGAYDANGNLITKNDQTYEYDLENRLQRVNRTVYTFTRQLEPGWNFVSLPVEPLRDSVEETLAPLQRGADYDQVSRFNAALQKYEHSVGIARYDQFSTLARGPGYQLHVTNPAGAALKVKGLLPKTARSLGLSTGWNLLGNPGPATAQMADLLRRYSVGTDYDQAAKYNPAAGSYDRYKGQPTDPFQTLQPADAFFLQMRHGADWPLGTASSAGTLTSAQETVAAFTYDSAGGRVKQITSTATTHYLGGLYEVESTAAGSTPAKQIFLGPMRVATRRTGTNTGTFFSHPDHLGSTALLTNAKGEVAQRVEYLPFGSVWKNAGTIDLPQKFTGKPLDAGTGLYYFGARYYDPELGRWITPDPTIPNPFNPQSLNRYSYVDNNPLKYTDPTGLKKSKWKQWLGKIVGAIAAAVTFAVTGGNLAAAFAVYNLVDSVTTAAVNGGDIGRALASAVASAALNFALPGAGSSANFLVNAGVNAARQAGIAAVTAAITGGDPARAALGGLVSGAAGVIPYVGTIVGAGAAAEIQGGKFAQGAIGGAFDVGLRFALSGRGQRDQAVKGDLVVVPFARAVTIPGFGWAMHTGWALANGTPLWEVGPGLDGKNQMNFYTNFLRGRGNTLAESTYTGTLNAFNNGTITYGSPRMTTLQSFVEAADNYQARFVDTGRTYSPVYENSNFAADWVGRHSGAGEASGVGLDPGGLFAPGDY